jgi:hypothetical protein
MDHLLDRVDALEQQLHTLQQHTQTLQQHTHTVTRRLRWWRGLAGGLLVLAVLTWAMPAVIAQEEAATGGQRGLAHRVAALEQLLKHFSREDNEVFLTGANLHIVNGLGQTDCGSAEEPIPDCPNRLGNLIVGYNELRGEGVFPPNVRTGSHNVVVGQEHNFSRFGGFVVGFLNEISGDFASISGGTRNTASGFTAVVSGGTDNTASGSASSVSGGQLNMASGSGAVVSAGVDNRASGEASSVSGGQLNTASGVLTVVSGGTNNTASGGVVSGGQLNTASGFFSSVSGGQENTASGFGATVSGGVGITQETEDGWAAGSVGGEVSGSFRSP